MYKLQIADEAYDNAFQVINNELTDKKAIYNMYKLQSNYIEKMSWILNDSNYGKSPIVPNIDPESNRIFTSRKYNPPKMWSTHPADKDREENAKRIYISANIDSRSSRDLLSDPDEYEVSMTAALVSTAKVETNIMKEEESLKAQNEEYFNWTFLNPKYNSIYLNRFLFLNFEKIDDIYEGSLNHDNLKTQLENLYPQELSVKVDQLKEVNEEIEALIVIENETFTTEKRIITHRGEQIKKADIPDIISSLKEEEKLLRNYLSNHDKICRKSHYDAAILLNEGWGDYLKKLSGLVHYSEHSIENLNDCSRKFNNVLNIALADGRVSSSELADILNASNEYYYAVRKIYSNSKVIRLDEALLKKFKLSSYEEAYEKFTLTEAVKENINEWVTVIDGWANVALNNLNKLRNISLEQLLDTEDIIKAAFLKNEKIEKELPKGIVLVDNYHLLLPGNERSIQRKLSFWNRFFMGDGLYPSIAKFGVSAAMIFGALFFGNYSQKSTLYIYNGLNISVDVSIDGINLKIYSNSYESLPINYGADYKIISKTEEGYIIEELSSEFDDPS